MLFTEVAIQQVGIYYRKSTVFLEVMLANRALTLLGLRCPVTLLKIYPHIVFGEPAIRWTQLWFMRCEK